jgi:hypothetical protein
MRLIWLTEAFRMFGHAMSRRINGLPRYPGHAQEICGQILERCWNQKKSYYQVSTGHFREFYTRDFAWCARPLVNLGHKERVKDTLAYALERFAKHGRVTVAINPRGRPFDFPRYAVDSLPCLVHALSVAGASDLVKQYRSFLKSELDRFVSLVLDKQTGLVRKDKVFSSARDHSIRKSSCYDNCMLAMMSKDLKELGFQDQFALYDYSELIIENFWNGSAFLDDLSGDDRVSGDANVFPPWCGVVTEKQILSKAIEALSHLRLDKPFPLKYGVTHPELNFADLLVPDYERDTVWTYLGLLYIDIVSRVDTRQAKEYLEQYTDIIGKYGNVLELFDREGKPFKTLLYYADDSMLWASIYLDLVRRLK